METHVKVLGVLYIVLGAFGILGAIVIFLGAGAAAGIVGTQADPGDAAIAVPIIGAAGTLVAAFLAALAVPGIIAGAGLIRFRPWARILGIVLSILNLIQIPFGTAIGIYGLWVLLNSSTEPLFRGAATLPSTTT
ncbi:MAG TPA: hypothetical protein VFK20_03570 [Vicinamibacterales bacterium]|nr:hypothetical protein [Vicinamibacterales bacterium]